MTVRPFSSAKTSDMEYYITPTKKDIDPDICILHVSTNDLTLDDAPEEITKHIVDIAASLKTGNNTVVISKSKKEKTEAVNKLLVNTCEQQQNPLWYGNINRERHLNKSRVHLNADGKSIFVRNI